VASDRLQRIVRIVDGLHDSFVDHETRCGDWVSAVAISNADFDELMIVDIWGLPVLAWDEVDLGKVRLLCEAVGTVVPPHDTVDDLQDIWHSRLQPPSEDPQAAA
jgi:hypothetical protein